MNWQPNITPSDRAFSVLPYIMPIIEAIALSLTAAGPTNSILIQVPIFQPLLVILAPIMQIYLGVPFASFIIFILLFLLVVRNDKISRFIRYNTMQAIMLDIVVFLCGLIIRVVFAPIGGFIVQTLASTVFLGILVGSIYSIVQSVRGEYAEIPTISDAVQMQIR
ncbi:MAG: Tic20 family protein [Cyanophyceae cyanobacterium]